MIAAVSKDLHILSRFSLARQDELTDARADAITDLGRNAEWLALLWKRCCAPRRLYAAAQRLERLEWSANAVLRPPPNKRLRE